MKLLIIFDENFKNPKGMIIGLYAGQQFWSSLDSLLMTSIRGCDIIWLDQNAKDSLPDSRDTQIQIQDLSQKSKTTNL